MLALGGVVSIPLNWRCQRLCKASRSGAAFLRRPCYGAAFMQKVWCCSNEGQGEGKEGEEEWSVEGQVEKMLNDEESKALIRDLNAAVERVAKARRELDALEEQQSRAAFTDSLVAADSLVEECQRSVFAAELDAKNAEIALVKARAGSSIMDLEEEEEGAIDRDAERVESGKAAGVSGVMGTLAGLPFFSAAHSEGLELAVSAGIVFLSCCVFGLTYRYAVRRNLRNTQLKAGCIAAFALVRSLDVVRLLVTLSPQNVSEQLLQGGMFFTESIAIFCFAAVGLEYCFRQRFVSPFPLQP